MGELAHVLSEFGHVSLSAPVVELRMPELNAVKAKALKLLAELIRKKGKKPEDFVVRDILPATDLGLSTEEWSFTPGTANAWNTFIDRSLPDDRFIVIFAFVNLSPAPKITAVKFWRGSIPERVYQVEHVYANTEYPVLPFEPIGYSEGERIKVELYATATDTQKPVLRGYIAEPRGETIGSK